MKIRDWETWQCYRRDRGTPPWIKVHRNLLSNQKWARLSDADKGQLVSLWIVAADSNGILPDDPKVLKKICQLDDEPNIKLFIELGLMETSGCHDGVTMASTCQPDDAPETEAETDIEYNPPLSPLAKNEPQKVNGQAEAETVKNGSQGSESLFDHLTHQTGQPEPHTGRQKRSVGQSKTKPHPLPLEWEPDEKLWSWAKNYYPMCISAAGELDKFKDFFFSNGREHADWSATFRNWIRESVKRQAERQGKMPTGDGSTFKTISRFTAGQKLVV